jgi:hypothetical protein
MAERSACSLRPLKVLASATSYLASVIALACISMRAQRAARQSRLIASAASCSASVIARACISMRAQRAARQSMILAAVRLLASAASCLASVITLACISMRAQRAASHWQYRHGQRCRKRCAGEHSEQTRPVINLNLISQAFLQVQVSADMRASNAPLPRSQRWRCRQEITLVIANLPLPVALSIVMCQYTGLPVYV